MPIFSSIIRIPFTMEDSPTTTTQYHNSMLTCYLLCVVYVYHELIVYCFISGESTQSL